MDDTEKSEMEHQRDIALGMAQMAVNAVALNMGKQVPAERINVTAEYLARIFHAEISLVHEWYLRIEPLIPYIEDVLKDEQEQGNQGTAGMALIDVLSGMEFTGEITDERVRPIIEKARGLRFAKESRNLPTSTAADLFMMTLVSDGYLEGIEAGKRRVNHSEKIYASVNADTGEGELSLFTKKENLVLQFDDVDKFLGNSRGSTQKFLTIALRKINEQAFHNGQLTRDYIIFPFEEMVGPGQYESIRTARAGFKRAVESLTSWKIKGKTKRGKVTISDQLRVVFTGSDISNNCGILQLNTGIDWTGIIQYFTLLPRYYDWLPARAGSLLYSIVYLARQNVNSIKQRGYFTVGLRTAQYRMGLPDETHTATDENGNAIIGEDGKEKKMRNRNPGRVIKQEIIDAVDEIMGEHHRLYGDTGLDIAIVADPSLPIEAWLDTGHIKVSFEGLYKSHFEAIATKTAKQIEAAEKRKERAIEAAAKRGKKS